MTAGMYIKVDGDYKLVSKPALRRAGVYTALTHAYVRKSGNYELCYQADTTPPDSPELTLELIDNRYIRVGARIPGASHDYSVKKIRILVSDKAQPSSPDGDGGVFQSDKDYPGETWSNWYYNGADTEKPISDHGNTNDLDYKQYPPNPTSDTNLPDQTRYYFSAWAQDFDGRWSAATTNSIWKPKKTTDPTSQVVKDVTFQPGKVGTLYGDGSYNDIGYLKVQDSPQRDGVFYYGTKFAQAMGNDGTPTIQSAQILIIRRDDAGEPEANVRLGWHGQASGDPVTSAQIKDTTFLGKINKGERKWFNIPTAFYNNFYNDQIKGFCLVHGSGSGSYMEAKGIDTRCGDVTMHWVEKK